MELGPGWPAASSGMAEDGRPVSSEKKWLMFDSGLCIVSKMPLAGEFASGASYATLFGVLCVFVMVADAFGATSHISLFGVDGLLETTGADSRSAMADTAASTFFSKSSSEMLSTVRSIFSINWMAPICMQEMSMECETACSS